jgi:hypothetical protein
MKKIANELKCCETIYYIKITDLSCYNELIIHEIDKDKMSDITLFITDPLSGDDSEDAWYKIYPKRFETKHHDFPDYEDELIFFFSKEAFIEWVEEKEEELNNIREFLK